MIRHSLRSISTVLASLAILLCQNVPAQASGGSSLSLAPASGNYAIGSNFSITVHENSGVVQVNAVEADLTYDASRLQFLSASIASGAFTLGPAPSGGGGTVSLAGGAASPTTGDQIAGTVSFKVIGVGAASPVVFAGTSAVVRFSDAINDWNGVTAGGSYNFSSPIYRLANYITHERLFTIDGNESGSINGHNGWVYEGVAFNSVNSAGSGAMPVYRLANYITHERLFTTDLNEKNSINGRNGWVYENIAFHALPAGSVTVYRLANYITHERLFTTNVTEKNSINGHNGWVYESVAFFQN